MKLVDFFHTIQGEGRYAGTLATFIRFPDCNLFCGLDKPLLRTTTEHRRVVPYAPSQKQINKMKSKNATWVCDTMEQWRQSGKEYNAEDVAEKIKQNYDHSNYHVVFTGGEPLLHKDWIEELIAEIDKLKYPPSKYEIETNGTIMPIENKRITYNVSVKLANSGIPREMRIHNNVLSKYMELEKSMEIYWKFVVNRIEDVYEALLLFPKENYVLRRDHIYLIPGAYTRKEVVENSKSVVEFCKRTGLNYSPRLQIFIYDKTVGV